MGQFGFKRFARDESGAVTVDWVVLAALVVGLAAAVFTVITRESVTGPAQVVDNTLEKAADGSIPGLVSN